MANRIHVQNSNGFVEICPGLKIHLQCVSFVPAVFRAFIGLNEYLVSAWSYWLNLSERDGIQKAWHQRVWNGWLCPRLLVRYDLPFYIAILTFFSLVTSCISTVLIGFGLHQKPVLEKLPWAKWSGLMSRTRINSLRYCECTEKRLPAFSVLYKYCSLYVSSNFSFRSAWLFCFWRLRSSVSWPPRFHSRTWRNIFRTPPTPVRFSLFWPSFHGHFRPSFNFVTGMPFNLDKTLLYIRYCYLNNGITQLLVAN